MSRCARVLIVDDFRETADVLSLCVKLLGHDSRTALDARAARAAATAFRPDLAILDLRLPGDDGLRLGSDLRARFPAMYLVLMTGFSRPDLPRRSAEAGFDRYVLKPVGMECLRELVDSYAGSSASRASSRASASASTSCSSSGPISGKVARSA